MELLDDDFLHANIKVSWLLNWYGIRNLLSCESNLVIIIYFVDPLFYLPYSVDKKHLIHDSKTMAAVQSPPTPVIFPQELSTRTQLEVAQAHCRHWSPAIPTWKCKSEKLQKEGGISIDLLQTKRGENRENKIDTNEWAFPMMKVEK